MLKYKLTDLLSLNERELTRVTIFIDYLLPGPNINKHNAELQRADPDTKFTG